MNKQAMRRSQASLVAPGHSGRVGRCGQAVAGRWPSRARALAPATHPQCARASAVVPALRPQCARALAAALALALLVALCVAAVGAVALPRAAYAAPTSSISWYTADQTKTTYSISTPAQLRGLAELVNGTAEYQGTTLAPVSFEGVTLVQTSDFSLGDWSSGSFAAVEFTPIGTAEHPFAGTYDGGSHSISGLHISAVTSMAGLFGHTSPTSTVKNLSLMNPQEEPSTIAIATGTAVVRNVGSLVGRAEGAVTSCASAATITVASTTAATAAAPYVVQNVGGLVGSCTSDVTSCSFTGTLDASIATNSYNATTTSESLRVADSFGGVVGRFGDPETYGTLSESYNEGTIWVRTTGAGSEDRFGTVTYARAFFVGGVCGYSNGSVVNCHNGSFNPLRNEVSGLVSTSATDAADGGALDNRGGDQVSGVVGGLRSVSDDPDRYNDGSPDHRVRVQNCYNVGKVVGCVSVGGVVGEAGCYTTVTQCYNGVPSKEVPGHVVSTRWNKPISGGVAGRMWGSVLSYCANYAVVENIQTGYYMAGVCGAIWKSDDYPQLLPEMYGCLNTGNVWTANRSDKNQEYREAGLLGSNEGYAHDSIMLQGTVPYHSDAAIGDMNWGMTSNLLVMTQGQLQTSAAAAVLNATAAPGQAWDCYWFINASGYPILNIWAGEVDRVELTAESIQSVEMTKEAAFIGEGAEPVAQFSITLKNGTVLVQNSDFYVVPQTGAWEMTGGELRYSASIVGIGMYRGTVASCAPYAIGKGDLSQATVAVAEGTYAFGRVVFPTSVEAKVNGKAIATSEYSYVIYDSTTGSVAAGARTFAVYDSEGYVSFDGGASLVPVAGVDLNAETRDYLLYDRSYEKISDSAGQVYYVEGSGGAVGTPITGHTSCIGMKSGTPAGYTVQVTAKVESVLVSGSAVGYFVVNPVSLYTDCTLEKVTCGQAEWLWDADASQLYAVDANGQRIAGMPAATFTGETIAPTAQMSYQGYALAAGTDFRVISGDPDPANIDDEASVGEGEGGEGGGEASNPAAVAPNRNVTGSDVRAALTIVPANSANLSNYVIAYFGIAPAAFEQCDISLTSSEWAYTGQAVEPVVSVKLNGVELVKDVDYAVAYDDNVEKGQASYTVTPLGNLSGGSLEPRGGTFDIVDGTSLTTLTLDAVADQQFNFGADVHPALVFRNAGSQPVSLVEGTDYQVSYSTANITKWSAADAGTPCTATITGIGKYVGSLSATFHIVPFDAAANANGQLEAMTQDLSYGTWGAGDNGKSAGVACPVMAVRAYPIVNWATMERGEARVISTTMSASWGKIDTCAYFDAAGAEVTYDTAQPGAITARITLVTGSTGTKGGATGTLEAQATYSEPTDIAQSVVWSITGDRTYDGTPRCPVVGTTKGGNIVLVEGTDYAIEYQGNVEVGSASFTVTALEGSHYTGTYAGSFSVLPANLATVATADPLAEQSSKDVPVEPAVVVRVGNKVLQEGIDYLLAYANNDVMGTATVYVTGKGNYGGRIELPFTITRVPSKEIAGPTRIETALAAAFEAYPTSAGGAAGVIVATAWNYPDALAASSLAGALDYPILLTEQAALPASVAAAIADLGATHAIVVGSNVAVSDEAFAQVAAIVGGNAERLQGTTRIGTQMAIYEYGQERNLWQGDPIVATAWNFPDALSISSYAAAKRAPLFLEDGANGLSADAKAALVASYAGRRTIIVGSEVVVSASTEAWLASTLGVAPVRLAGALNNGYPNDRYGTSAAIATFCLSEGMSVRTVAIATGRNYPDALVSGPLQAKNNGLILLVSGNSNAAYPYATALDYTAVSAVANAAADPAAGTRMVLFLGSGSSSGPLSEFFRANALSILAGDAARSAS